MASIATRTDLVVAGRQAARGRSLAKPPWWQRIRAGVGVSRRTAGRAERSDANGKAYVLNCLQRLGDDWRVLHDVPLAGRDAHLDHLLIGPQGVFIVSAIHHANKAVWLGGDTMIVNGQRVNHARRCRQEAARVSELLTRGVGFDIPVMGLVVIVGDKKFNIRHQARDAAAYVAPPRAALRWVRDHDIDWTSWGVQRIYDVAQRASTWHDQSAEQFSDQVTDQPLEIAAAS